MLGELVTFQRGYDLPRTKMQGGIYPVIGSSGIIGYHNEYTTEAPSITIGRSGNVGKPHLYKGKSWTHNTALYIKEYKNVNQMFIYYLLQTLNLGSYAGGTAVPTLNRNHIHSLSLAIPPLKVQEKITAILSPLDDKIELNRRINANLEQQAQTVFKYMFSEVLYGNRTIGEYIIPERGQSLLSKNAIHGNIPVIAGGTKPTTYHNIANTKPPVVTIAASGTAGFVSLWHVPVWSSDSSFIDSKMTEHAYFWYLMLKTRQQEIYRARVGSVQPHIYPQHIASMPTGDINMQQVNSFTEKVTPLFKMIGLNQAENNILAQILDSLLPKLISGEIEL